jgi:hypothetical protein
MLSFLGFAEVSRSVGEARVETESQQHQIHAGRAVRSRERRDEGHAAAINDSCCTKSEHEEGGPAISFHASRSN